MPKPAKTAILYRMVMDKHICPYGIKAKWLLEKSGYQVDDRHLTSRAQTDDLKSQLQVDTTPQIMINGERVGGYTDLQVHLGQPAAKPDQASYTAVIAVFCVAGAMAISLNAAIFGDFLTARLAEWFVGFSMAMLAMLKLQDIEKFSTMFLGYDLLARRFVPYAYSYPFLEAFAAILMIGHWLPWLSIPVAFTIGTIGAASVIHAVYVQKRDIQCACVGGSAKVPLGFVSLTENFAMIAMAIWMAFKYGVA
ncbi:MauE/DoxX family redox-associated membrane protein [Pontixanthobacter sp.]|uniref:MauE/DoxX family redox-associated membrane protein n=1 Tax=Pontixanthobacter sp. TaxID=2792078 RepID=UPI003C798130